MYLNNYHTFDLTWDVDILYLSLAITFRYHSGGSMKLNACILLLAHMVYLHNSTIYTGLTLYKSTWHHSLNNPLITPLIIPLLPEEPSSFPEFLLLIWNPSFACGAIPVHSGPRLLVNWPLPPSSVPPHSHFLPNGSPFQLCALLRWHRDLDFT